MWRWHRTVLGVPLAAAPLLVFALFRLADLAITVFIGVNYQWQSGQPPTMGSAAPPVMLQPPSASHSVQYWDVLWYRQVAEHGYPRDLPRDASGAVEQNAWAFYPVYPALARVFMTVGLPFWIAGTLVSLLAGGLAMCLLFDLMLQTTTRFAATATVAALNAFPAAVSLGVPYTESVALLLIVAALWLLRRQQYAAVVLVVVILALARPVELPLAPVIALHGALRWHRERGGFGWGERAWVAAATLASVGSFLLWPLITGLVTGESDAYYLTQQAWHLDFGTLGWHSWLNVALHGGTKGLQTWLVLLGIVAVAALARGWSLEARAWTICYTVYMAAVAWPTTAAWRYAMLAIFPWWPFTASALRRGERDRPGRTSRIAVMVAIVALGLLGQTMWVLRVWVPGPEQNITAVP